LDIEALRKQIPTAQKMAYFNTGWEGPSPVSVVKAIEERLEYESYNGPSTPEVLESGEAIAKQAKEAVANLVNASPEEIALTENTTEGLNVVLNGLPWKPGDEIVTCNLEHPSVLLPSYNLQQRAGVKVKIVTLSSNSTHDEIVAKFEAALTPKTRMVFISHIEYSCGLRMPVKRIRQLTQGRGIWMLLDGAQGPGHVRLDMRDIGCDFYAMPGHKWLLGPDGTGALYIRKEMLEQVSPVRVGYRFAKSFDQSGNLVPLTDSIEKFRVSTTSAPLRAGYLEAVRFHQGIGSDAVEQRGLTQAARLKAALSAIPAYGSHRRWRGLSAPASSPSPSRASPPLKLSQRCGRHNASWQGPLRSQRASGHRLPSSTPMTRLLASLTRSAAWRRRLSSGHDLPGRPAPALPLRRRDQQRLDPRKPRPLGKAQGHRPARQWRLHPPGLVRRDTCQTPRGRRWCLRV
jgi:L-cysteine/cystine lyase